MFLEDYYPTVCVTFITNPIFSDEEEVELVGPRCGQINVALRSICPSTQCVNVSPDAREVITSWIYWYGGTIGLAQIHNRRSARSTMGDWYCYTGTTRPALAYQFWCTRQGGQQLVEYLGTGPQKRRHESQSIEHEARPKYWARWRQKNRHGGQDAGHDGHR